MVSAIKHIKAVELYNLIAHLKSQAALKTLEELGQHMFVACRSAVFDTKGSVCKCDSMQKFGSHSMHFTSLFALNKVYHYLIENMN
jgi:hypothetical protein